MGGVRADKCSNKLEKKNTILETDDFSHSQTASILALFLHSFSKLQHFSQQYLCSKFEQHMSFVRFRKCTWLAVFFACRNHWGVLVNTTKARFAQVNIKTSSMQSTTYLVSAARVKARNVTSLKCMQIEVPMAISTRSVRRMFWQMRLVIYGLKVSLYRYI